MSTTGVSNLVLKICNKLYDSTTIALSYAKSIEIHPRIDLRAQEYSWFSLSNSIRQCWFHHKNSSLNCPNKHVVLNPCLLRHFRFLVPLTGNNLRLLMNTSGIISENVFQAHQCCVFPLVHNKCIDVFDWLTVLRNPSISKGTRQRLIWGGFYSDRIFLTEGHSHFMIWA